MKDNILIYAYRGFLATIYFLFGKKSKIAKMFLKEDKDNKNDAFAKHQVIIEKEPKKHYRYMAVNQNGKVINSTFDAYNMKQAKKYLTSIGLDIVWIKERAIYDKDIYLTSPISMSQLSFSLTQLSTFLRSGITLIESVKLLAKQETNKEKQKIYHVIAYDLLMGDDLSVALEKQKNVFPKLLINMVKSAELTGDLPSVLDEMAKYYASIDKTKKEIRSAMAYPTLVFIFSIIVVTFVLVWVVPQYQVMFKNFGAKLPTITVATINVSTFIRNNALTLLLSLIIILSLYLYLFMKVNRFRLFMQKIYLHTPIVKKTIMYSEVSMFARTFASLINHGVQAAIKAKKAK